MPEQEKIYWGKKIMRGCKRQKKIKTKGKKIKKMKKTKAKSKIIDNYTKEGKKTSTYFLIT